MTLPVNQTHDPTLASWVESANRPDSDFPIQNLPFGVFRRTKSDEPFRGGVAIGDQILDLTALLSRTLFDDAAHHALAACREPALNRFMSMGQAVQSHLRACLSSVLRSGCEHASLIAADLVPQADAEYDVPARIGDFTDFYASIHHATSVGRLFRPDNPLLPNYRWIPIAYNGRSSSIQVSEHAFQRPVGQRMAPGASAPELAASERLDFELELGLFIGRGNAEGSPIPLDEAESHVFGLCLLNDWSARDIQSWEYQPLGPFLGKNFATTLSPWVVSLEALAPFRIPFTRPATDPQPLAYLDGAANRNAGGIDITLEVSLQTSRMRHDGIPPQPLARSNFRYAYWTLAQLITHHSVNGCNLRPGDLFGSGTLSGPAPEQAGSLLELTAGGRLPLHVGADTRTFLEDGDRVVLRAWCERPGHRRIGFGSAAGTVLPARAVPPAG